MIRVAKFRRTFFEPYYPPYVPLGGFHDPFTDGSLDPFWQTSGTTITESGGILNIAGNNVAHIRSVNPVDFTYKKKIRCQFINSPFNANYDQHLMIASSDSFTQFYLIQQLNGNLVIQRNAVTQFTTTYSHINHAWVQIRTDSGTIYFDVSSDGITFPNIYSQVYTMDLRSMYIYLRKYTNGATATVYFDNFDSDDVPFSPPAASLGGFSDNFDDGSLNAWWQTSGVTISETGGMLEIAGNSIAHVRSVSAYNMANKTIRVMVRDGSDSNNYTTGLVVAPSDALASYYYFDILAGNFRAFRHNGSLPGLAYVQNNTTYLQLRFTATHIFFEYSYDGVNFTSIANEAFNFSVASLHVYLRKYATVSKTVKYDNFDSNL